MCKFQIGRRDPLNLLFSGGQEKREKEVDRNILYRKYEKDGRNTFFYKNKNNKCKWVSLTESNTEFQRLFQKHVPLI